MNNSQKPDLEEKTNVRVSHRDVDREAAAAAREMTIRENGLEPISGVVIILLVLVGLVAGGVLFKDSFLNYGQHPEGYRRGTDPNSTAKGPPIGEAYDTYFKKGQELFGGNCASCHGGDGSGAGPIPPLAGSEWVNKDDVHLLAIAVNGIQGPIQVMGKTYNGAMPNVAASWGDYELAALSTYLRNAFAHDSGKVTSLEQIKDLRDRVKARKAAGFEGSVTAEELTKEEFWSGNLKGDPIDNATKVNKKTGEPEA